MSETVYAPEEKQEALWVLAKVKDSICAIDGRNVESIQMLDEPIRSLPGSDAVHVGVLRYRGSVIEAIDLRSVMGLPTLAEEEIAFEQLLEQRKQDHVRWVNELLRCTQADEPFTLATDPHKCAFGKWYDNYKTDNQTVMFHLRKIEEPHEKLHATAHEAIACKRNHDACPRKECLKKTLKRATDDYMPRVVGLLDEAKVVFKNTYRKMAVVLSDGITTCAVLVDEVSSAGSLASMVENKGIENMPSGGIVSHIAQSSDSAQQILVLNLARLFETASA